MDVFELRNHLIDEYQTYITSFIQIKDERIREFINDQISQGVLWPDPLIQLNPSFQPGRTIDELISEGLLHPECSRIFRIKKETPEEKILSLHQHQEEAIRLAAKGENYILTTGTGSGKSLAYIVPIVDFVLKHGSGKGIKAIIVYPMNALANSQLGELEKFINLGYPNHQGSIRFARYTGQETDEQRIAIRANPPDILLTNYVMLELLLTRPEDRKMILQNARGLQFLVLDELHTYRGRQGADVAMLVRRLRDAVGAEKLQCVGTSATLVSGDTFDEQQSIIAELGSTFFGTQFHSHNIIGETLTRATEEKSQSDQNFIEVIKERLDRIDEAFPEQYDAFVTDPIASWIESTFGVTREPDTERLIRTVPISITGKDGAAEKLSYITGVPTPDCAQIIMRCLMKGYEVENPKTKFPVFAFRLHQFISPGDTVYTTLEPPTERYLTVNYQQYRPGDRSKILLPVVFCRECGQEYYSVRVSERTDGQRQFFPRDFNDLLRGDESRAAYIKLNLDAAWPSHPDEIVERLPDDWLELHQGITRVRPHRVKQLPEHIRVDSDGNETDEGLTAVLLNAPFQFCLNCGVAYSSRLRSDITKLTSLSSGGRSTSTTILSLATIRKLQEEGYLNPEARKLLSFTDNRQDAALQAGHFNDFVETSLIRAALYRAVVEKGDAGLRHDELGQRVFATLDLPIELYASDSEVRFAARRETEDALKDVLAYRLYRDLRRGWRVTAPNLEQCGLLQIKYLSLEDVCAEEEVWEGCHAALTTATPKTREKIAHALLDYMRRELAVQVQYLTSQDQDRIRQRSYQRLIYPWAIDENEKLDTATILYPRGYRENDFRGNLYMSGRSGFGLYLNNQGTIPEYGNWLELRERDQIIRELLEALRIAGIVEIVDQSKDDKEVPGYQLKAASMIWLASDGKTPFHDPIRMPRMSQEGGKTNPFFVKFYQDILEDLKRLRAREHTAQVPYDKREERENEFREGRLPILYCSPTMELGIDIAQLNVVNMRNVPPTPANYAQRSGRAGRSGQPALVFTYCAKGSPHDQYFFKRQARMVSGVVTPPRLDLANDDLVRAHLQAIWLAETNTNLGTSLRDILDLTGDPPSLNILETIKSDLENESAFNRSKRRAEKILNSLEAELSESDWFNAEWLNHVFAQIPFRFEQACERCRDLYRAALKQKDQQDAIIRDASRTSQERERARMLRREAENQLELLLDSRNVMQSDFYIYRYFASEGFLPGYNFPRLPLSAYIPARRVRTEEGEYLSRPRFLAISEFGPRSIVYHEGSRYVINRVIMQVNRTEDDQALATERAKICPACGYLHQIRDGDGLDLCERCASPLEGHLSSLFRMQNVSTKRRDRINSDEEERFRLGYEIRTTVRFHQDNEHLHVQRAEVAVGNSPVAYMSYGNAATIWRINLGWRRRQSQEQFGFVLDIEQGYWQKNEVLEDDPDDPMGVRTQRIIPYVEDRKNALIFEPAEPLAQEQMASLMAALKKAIQVNYQLEDSELAAEALPTEDDRRVILFYESSEGGAGALRQLVKDPSAFSDVARSALDICHYDPETGEDLEKALLSDEVCEAACYDCLMSYYNQREHRLLDRKIIRDLLFEYKEAKTKTSPVSIARDEHHEQLHRLCQSEFEEKWLDYLHQNGYRLPSKAQHLIADCNTRPDFLYEEDYVAIYVDGYHHLDEKRRERDVTQQSCLEDMGYTVLRFGIFDDWSSLIEQNKYLFGDKA